MWAGAAAALAFAVTAAACGGSDAPALNGTAPGGATPTTAVAGGPPVSVVAVGAVEAPVIGGPGGATATAAARAVVTRLASGGRTCPVRIVASTPKLVSLRWDCTDHTVATVNFAVPSGRQLQLGDVLQGGWAAYLSSTAQAQLQVSGATAAQAAAAAPPDAAAYPRWNLTPRQLQVVCTLPSGPVTLSFPLATLTPYLKIGVV